MRQDVGKHFAIVTCLVLHALGRGAISKIEITRKPCGTGKMRFRNPQAVTLDSQLVSPFEPLAVFMVRRLLSAVDTYNHGGEERRLGPREVVGAVGVQDGAVMLDFEQEIVHHVASKVAPAIAEKSHA